MLEQILAIFDFVRDTFKDANLQIPAYNRSRIEKALSRDQSEALIWIEDFQKVCKYYHTVKALAKPEAWKYWELMSIVDGIWEIEELERTKALIKERWLLRPYILRKHTHGESKEAIQNRFQKDFRRISHRPKAAGSNPNNSRKCNSRISDSASM